ncbi:MAG: hypothetical protein IT179_22665 [Acidobacteria bacterium]|nr:hypothetical protein [Acidobacteriota bacterium]
MTPIARIHLEDDAAVRVEPPATTLAEAGPSRAERDATYWVALLHYVGCTGHAHGSGRRDRRRPRDSPGLIPEP